MTDLGFTHRWLPAPGARRTLLLLHGTGGDENDLVPLGRSVAPDANLLSPRGKVLEAGMPRYFRRLAEGVLDLDDLETRTHDLADFLLAAAREYRIDLATLTAVGYSNGANVAVNLLWRRPETLAGAALLRAMLPYEPKSVPSLAGKRVAVLAGARDPYSRKPAGDRLAAIFRGAGADATLRYANAGHELSAEDVDAARAWLAP